MGQKNRDDREVSHIGYFFLIVAIIFLIVIVTTDSSTKHLFVNLMN